MKKTLVILAAGMGSRFGGMKQVEPVGPNGEFIIDYSIHDAIKAGFSKCVFIIRKENEEIFRSTIGKRLEGKIEIAYAYQELDNIPLDIKIEREKPLGTAHALYCALPFIEGAYALITADDYYGYDAFNDIASFLDNEKGICIVGYKIGDTILEGNEVKRGVISLEGNDIKSIIECKVTKNGDVVKCVPLNGNPSFEVSVSSYASMLLNGFSIDIKDLLENDLINFLNTADLKSDEFLLTDIIDKEINEGVVKVVPTNAKWMGMTYREDLEKVKNQINDYINKGIYNNNLWEE